jgi:hypothetical protein
MWVNRPETKVPTKGLAGGGQKATRCNGRAIFMASFHEAMFERKRRHVLPVEFAPRPVGAVNDLKNALAEAGDNAHLRVINFNTGLEGFQPVFVKLQNRGLKPLRSRAGVVLPP